MDWRTQYQDKLLTLEQAAGKISEHELVLASMGTGVPYALLDAITARKIPLELLTGMVASPIRAYLPPFSENIRVTNWFYGPIERASLRMKPAMSYQPMHLSDTSFDRTGSHRPDTVLLQVTPPDENGMLSQGTCPLPETVLQPGIRVIAQVNEALPYVGGEGTMIPAERVDWFTEKSAPIYAFEESTPNETEAKIAAYIVERIPDGACLQLGIGGVSSAVGSFLKEKKELGIHTEMFVDSMVELIECGAVTNSRKQIGKGLSLFGFAAGTRHMYDFLNSRRDIESRPFAWINDPRIICQNDNVVSVNSALEIDLTGQICAESIGQTQYSGTGGQFDYVRGAHWSRGGQSFIAMPSSRVDKKGQRHSKISLTLTPGAAVTTLRSDVQYVVTEFGVADLQNQPLDVRAQRLIEIAHPDFRDELRFQAKNAGLLL